MDKTITAKTSETQPRASSLYPGPAGRLPCCLLPVVLGEGEWSRERERGYTALATITHTPPAVHG